MNKLSILFLTLFLSNFLIGMNPEQQKPAQGKIYHFNQKATAYNAPGVPELSFIKVMFGQDISQTLMDRFTRFMSDELVIHDVKVRNLIGLNRLVFQGNFGITREEFQEALDRANKEILNAEDQTSHPQHVADGTVAAADVKEKKCEVCLEDQAGINFVVLSCEHTYCSGCLEYLVDQSIREKTSVQLKCPNTACAQPISQEDIKKITNHDQAKVEVVAEILTREFIFTQPGAKQCPTANCSYAFINDDHMQAMTCPQCEQKYCSHCLFDHEKTMTCQEADDLRPSDKDTAEWLQHNTKACPTCNARVERNGGCLYITCKMCKKGFCWNCNMDHHASVCSRPVTQQAIPQGQAKQEAINPQAIARERIAQQHRERIDREAAVRERAAQQARERAALEALSFQRRQEVEQEQQRIIQAERQAAYDRRFPNQPLAQIVSVETIMVGKPLKKIPNIIVDVRFNRTPSDRYFAQFSKYLSEFQRKHLLSPTTNDKDKHIQIRARMSENQIRSIIDRTNSHLAAKFQNKNWLD